MYNSPEERGTSCPYTDNGCMDSPEERNHGCSFWTARIYVGPHLNQSPVNTCKKKKKKKKKIPPPICRSESENFFLCILYCCFPSFCLFSFSSSSPTSTSKMGSLWMAKQTEDETPYAYQEGSDNGPEHWANIDPHWKTCGNGEMQSPIDLLNKRVQVLPELGKLKRDYRPVPAKVKNRGHDIAVEWAGDAGFLNINGTYYSLKQGHWHSPSEHTFNRSRYDLELHLVHYSDSGQIAVVGITYKYGTPDNFLSKLVPHIGGLYGMKEKDLGIINPGDIKFGSRKYYRYIGSLTVPPCTEGVIWTISKKVRTVSREQVRALRDAVHDGYEENARPIQHQNDRTVWLYTPRVTGGFT